MADDTGPNSPSGPFPEADIHYRVMGPTEGTSCSWLLFGSFVGPGSPSTWAVITAAGQGHVYHRSKDVTPDALREWAASTVGSEVALALVGAMAKAEPHLFTQTE